MFHQTIDYATPILLVAIHPRAEGMNPQGLKRSYECLQSTTISQTITKNTVTQLIKLFQPPNSLPHHPTKPKG
jgi:hypothetical protein